MKNLFKRIVAFHRENKQYDGFFQMECFGCITALLLVMNIIRLSTDPVDWMFLKMEMVVTSFYIERWLGNKKLKEFADFTKEIHDLDYNFTQSLIDQCAKEHARLVAANRRRKRAEKKLKCAKKMYRYALQRNLELQHRQNLQPEMVSTQEQMRAYGEVALRGIAEAVERHSMIGSVVHGDKLQDGMLRCDNPPANETKENQE